MDGTAGSIATFVAPGTSITGFTVNEVSYKEDSTIVFSAQEIYIDPDISRLIFGTIALSKVEISNAYLNIDKINEQINNFSNYLSLLYKQ